MREVDIEVDNERDGRKLVLKVIKFLLELKVMMSMEYGYTNLNSTFQKYIQLKKMKLKKLRLQS